MKPALIKNIMKSSQMNTIQTLLELSLAKGIARLDAELLLAQVLKVDRAFLYSRPESQVSDNDILQFASLVMRRLSGEPIAYLIGRKEFWSLDLKVKPSVLIPRPETELLVELALKLLPEESFETESTEIQVLDLGTGSGAIAIALASERPQWTIWATDISEEALKVAKENAQHFSKNPIHFYCGDWFGALPMPKPLFHAIISNPPYIAEADPHLLDGSLSFEPITALRSGKQGLQDIEKIIQSAPDYLLSKAWLLIEHGFDQSDGVFAFFKANQFIQIQHYQDLAGVTRVTVGQKA